MGADLEANITALERIKEMCDVPQEVCFFYLFY
jgi:hypothetical protein